MSRRLWEGGRVLLRNGKHQPFVYLAKTERVAVGFERRLTYQEPWRTR